MCHTCANDAGRTARGCMQRSARTAATRRVMAIRVTFAALATPLATGSLRVHESRKHACRRRVSGNRRPPHTRRHHPRAPTVTTSRTRRCALSVGSALATPLRSSTSASTTPSGRRQSTARTAAQRLAAPIRARLAVMAMHPASTTTRYWTRPRPHLRRPRRLRLRLHRQVASPATTCPTPRCARGARHARR